MMEKLKKMYKELNAAALTDLNNNNWSIEKKILYYKDIIWNIPFREIHHTVETVCEFVKPIYPNIDPLKYFEYFFSKINFLKIEKNTNKTETLKYCYAIYYGLERILKVDISKAILTYQNNISKLSKEQIQKTQIKLIKLIGNLKRQVRTNEPGISFTKHYIALSKEIKNNKEELQTIDYQILISHFRESMVNDLLSSFETIIETFKELTPLLKVSPPQQSETKAKSTISQIALKYVYEGLSITRENGNEIAKQYGYKSGEKLFQKFSFYSSKANRTGRPIPCTPTRLNNKIKLIEYVIELLPTDKQERAKDEVSILKKIYETEYL